MDTLQTRLIQTALLPDMADERLCAALEVLTSGTSSPPPEPARFLSFKDACAYCGHIARSTLHRWRQNGLASYNVGGRVLFKTSDLDAFVEKHTSRGPAAPVPASAIASTRTQCFEANCSRVRFPRFRGETSVTWCCCLSL